MLKVDPQQGEVNSGGSQNLDRIASDLALRSLQRRSLNAALFCNQRLLRMRISEFLKRCFDVLLGIFTFVLLIPALAGALLAAKIKGGGLRRTARLGRAGSVFGEYSFHFGSTGSTSWWYRSGLYKLPIVFNVLRGEMSMVGPRPFAPDEVAAADHFAWKRFDVKPGLICLWWIRQRANISYCTETEIDAEYVDGQCARHDLGILLRSIPASLYGMSATASQEKVNLLGIPIDNVTLKEAAHRIVQLARGTEPRQVCFVNADCVNIACRDAEYQGILRRASLTLADGIGMKLAGRVMKRPIRQNVNGTDLLPELCSQLAGTNRKLFLLGGQPGVASSVAAWIQRSYPDVTVGGFRHGYFSSDQLPELLAEIRNTEADILLVALGAPRQEKWIASFLPQTGCKAAVGVGGLFDFYAGRIPRAPIWVREIGMEWLFRFVQEPRRMWKRYFTGNFVFLARVFRARLRQA